MLDFLANYWPYLVILVVVILLFFVLRGFLKGLKARSPFNMENIRKSTEPNFLALQQKSKALLADADMICEIKPGSDQVIPKKEDVKFFRRAVSQKFKLAVFQVPGTNKVVFFFCKTEAGIKRRLQNLVINQKFREGKHPYVDEATGEKLRYPRA
ncbi:hypothetical protein [Fibrobacter sp. UWB12]|uniref:hypothetical protein n=1 Tax=Fibrobacter sp. UWB12 TaxID=1896203 RepID=UPI00091B01F5|nr:hypothetical protein [Fibrobacter sp. UWB12]SHK26182.1 hypothetical protein SAMN05720759_101401 [Fibrobacter sp. UWB12]